MVPTGSVSPYPLLLFGAALLSLACDRKSEEPAPNPAPTPAETSPAPEAKEASPHGGPQAHGSHGAAAQAGATPAVAIKWTAPEGWKEMPPRPMRKATYQIESEAGAAEVAVFYFGPGQGGDVDANIARWVGQFQGLEPGSEKRSEREVNGMKLHTVSVEKGTFASGMPGRGPAAPQENWAMLATIVQAKSGQYFFKLTGPSETVAAQTEAFTKMLDGITEN